MLLTTIHNTDIYLTNLHGAHVRADRRRVETEATAALVAEAFGSDARLVHDLNGAPRIDGSDVHISLSHSRFHAVMAVNRRSRVGIDVENMRTNSLMRVAARFLTPAELAVAPSGTALLEAWTVKEAIFKSLTPDKQPAGLIDIPLPSGWRPTLPPGTPAIISLHVADITPFTISLSL